MSDTDVQNNANMRGIISKIGNVYIMTGTIPSYRAENLSIGSYAKVTADGKNYDGSLYELTPTYNDLFETKVSIMTSDNISGEGQASIVGDMKKNIIIVPYSCIFTDEDGSDAIMLENRGYAVKRKVKLGRINNETGTEVVAGVFVDENLILNPKDVRIGDKVLMN